MLFNSGTFIIFFVTFFFLYWFVFSRYLKLQNLLVLAGSYVFYGWWDWRFLLLIISSSLMIYLVGIYAGKTNDPKIKKTLLTVGIVASIGSLFYFKYTNFFITSLIALFSKLHLHTNLSTLNIILPLGISFFTFRMLSYLFDISNGKIKPTTDWVVFFSYIAFFPSLVAGPIDRPKTLIPQLERPRVFDRAQATDGMRQILWGLFKKVVVADSCGMFTKYIFEAPDLHGLILVAGAFFFTIQLYTDFSGYSDMAIGFARLIGFNITRNFNYPYFSQNIAEFWRKWHISLTSWLTEYLFTPLSIRFRHLGNNGLIISILITFLISGLWHGANWTFIVWGFLNGCYYIPLILKGKMNKKKEIDPNKLFPSVPEFLRMTGTFLLVMFTMVLFRANGLNMAINYYHNIFTGRLLSGPIFYSAAFYIFTIVLTVFTFSVEWLQKGKQHALEIDNIRYASIRWGIYLVLFYVSMSFIVLSDKGNAGFLYIKF